MEEQERFISERLCASLCDAVRVLDSAERALSTRDAARANRVLSLEGGAQRPIGPVSGSVRGGAAVENILDLAMRVAELARIASKSDRVLPNEGEVTTLRADIGAVRALAAALAECGCGDFATLTRLVVRADAHAAAMVRACDTRRFACLAF